MSVLFQIGNLHGHFHLRHDDVDEFNKNHDRDRTDRLLLEDKVGLENKLLTGSRNPVQNGAAYELDGCYESWYR